MSWSKWSATVAVLLINAHFTCVSLLFQLNDKVFFILPNATKSMSKLYCCHGKSVSIGEATLKMREIFLYKLVGVDENNGLQLKMLFNLL